MPTIAATGCHMRSPTTWHEFIEELGEAMEMMGGGGGTTLIRLPTPTLTGSPTGPTSIAPGLSPSTPRETRPPRAT